ncbi:MAG: membrane protein insertion efficiency factor YidD [Christensenellaceae bacterium]|jgi:putative membrane protein insertion efficiency factor|nr:membrane protein insertion efficiency factor YidD [Christensenellaceae bacterium]
MRAFRTKILDILLAIYKHTFSKVVGKDCIYTPTCSVYFRDSVSEYGFIIGSFKGFLRVLRCNPFAKGGFDPVKPYIKGYSKWVL